MGFGLRLGTADEQKGKKNSREIVLHEANYVYQSGSCILLKQVRCIRTAPVLYAPSMYRCIRSVSCKGHCELGAALYNIIAQARRNVPPGMFIPA